MTEYQYGVNYVGRDLGIIWYEDYHEAFTEMKNTEDKYLPAGLVRRSLGPIEFNDCDGFGEWE